MPARLIEQQNGVRARSNLCADQLQVFRHCVGVTIGHDQTDALALRRAGSAEDVGPFCALIVRRSGAGSTFRPSAGDLVLLAEARFILKPDFYRRPAIVYAD